MDAPEFSANAAIAIEAVFERDRLNFVAQIRLRLLGLANLAKAIEAGARHAAEQAQTLDRGGALPLLRVHFFNAPADAVPPTPPPPPSMHPHPSPHTSTP